MNRITILYQFRIVPGDPEIGRIRQKAITAINKELRLVTWDLDDATVIDVRNVAIEDDEEVLALAVGQEKMVTIAFRVKNRPLTFRVRSFTSKSDRDPSFVHGE